MKVEIDLGVTEFPVKRMIEALCVAQTDLGAATHRHPLDRQKYIFDLQRLIDQLEPYKRREPGRKDNTFIESYVKDNRGIVWRLDPYYDNGMAFRANEKYEIESCGIEWLKNNYGPLEYL